MVRREIFESWPSGKKKRYAEMMYSRMRRILLEDCYDVGRYRDKTGNLITDTHHCWERSHCPLWWYFQRENLYPLSAVAHHEIHNIDSDRWSQATKDIFKSIQEKRELVINAERQYAERTLD